MSISLFRKSNRVISQSEAQTESQRLFAEAQTVIPGGVNSPVRSFRSVGGAPRVIERGFGAHLFDVDCRRYIDFIGGWGAAIAGHANAHVTRRVQDAAAQGLSFGTSSPPELALAKAIVARVPSVEKVRMVNSGTEAVMSAIRVARAATGRTLIVKFAGGYHGHADGMLVKAGSGAATLGLPDSPGVTDAVASQTLTATYNDFASVQSLFAKGGADIAAVIVEPVAGNMGVVPPSPGFLHGLRTITRENGALLIFDEVMTGFRVSAGGAQTLFDIRPDLTTFGKIIGGGMPVGAYGGPAACMDLVAPIGPVYQAGTLSGNPITMTAGLATLELLDDAAYRQLEQLGAHLEEGLRRAIADTGVVACVQRVGSMLTLFLGTSQVSDDRDANSTSDAMFAKFFHGMLDAGIHLPPSRHEAWFLSLAHDYAIIDATIAAARRSMTLLS
ncbi:MAG: glutamate-1-semialdehyde 2,1-aminomutase [Phycisphaerales bacterium]|nr:glutamate-1-semialdehyde 2,1-aminomutase [Phycisphaerales bacterium]MCB9862410.1 glutamate-1-semialdehyde 2,1-aminomutase [Phycisphaerales bacterium]